MGGREAVERERERKMRECELKFEEISMDQPSKT